MSGESAVTNGPRTVSLADEEAVKQILVSTVYGLSDVVNSLTRLRPSKRERYRVTIFGSARGERSGVRGKARRCQAMAKWVKWVKWVNWITPSRVSQLNGPRTSCVGH